jgi:hypothetical protein
VLYIGPPESHVTDIADQFKTDHIFVARHGNSDLIVEQITALTKRKTTASAFRLSAFSKLHLLPQMISLVELAAFSEGDNVNALAGNYSPDPDAKAQEVVSL